MTITPDMSIKSGPRFHVQRETKDARRWWFRGVATDSNRHPSARKPYWFDSGEYPQRPVRGNSFAVLSEIADEELTECARLGKNKRKVQMIVKLLRVDQSLEPVNPVPTTVVCGGIRKAVRSMYPPELTLAQELSIKTAQKCESGPCDYCENLQSCKLEDWENARYQPQNVDPDHLDQFEKAFRGNVPSGWDRRRTAYVPNGHACQGKSRCHGGNWNEQPFDRGCEVQLVVSSGKPRAVTLYSSHNVEVLTPLHNSLYTFLRRRSWLLVGSPTHERLRYTLDGGAGKEWLSFDYESATDNIKTAYVQRAVKVLIELAECLSDDEVQCLETLASLRLSRGVVESGQPMGSPMSFPLLCLINKTVVDMALTRQLRKGEIRVKEWTRHRCLINGDDLLLRSTSSGDLAEAITIEGAQVGLRTNKEKTLRSETIAEINSTAFENEVEQKKTNVASLWMGQDVSDVLGFADEACRTSDGFRVVAEKAARRLALASVKVCSPLSWDRKNVVRRSRALKHAVLSDPDREEQMMPNLFPVEPKPHGFSLTREEEVDTIRRRVAEIRKRGSWLALRPRASAAQAARRVRRAVPVNLSRKESNHLLWKRLRYKHQVADDDTLSCLVAAWEEKEKARLKEMEPWEGDLLPPGDSSVINRAIDCIKAFKDKRKQESGHITTRPRGLPPEEFGDYVRLDCT